MPSKSKKPSRSASKLSKSDQNEASPLNSSHLIGNSYSDLSEDEVQSYLEAASSKFPLLISKQAFVGRINVDIGEESKGCKIWLSESSMTSYSIVPGSVVSVSLVSPRNKISNINPLCSVAEKCATHFGFEEKTSDEVGSYFALATVFPSCKESLDASEITMQHFKSAIEHVEPSEIQSYDQLLTKFQRLVQSTGKKSDLVHQPSSQRRIWFNFW